MLLRGTFLSHAIACRSETSNKTFVSVNLMEQNEMTIHTLNDCTKAHNSWQTGTGTTTNCTDGPGCTVLETQSNSAGAGFAKAQGGVWATQFDVSGAPFLGLPIASRANFRHRHLVGLYVTLDSPEC